MIYITLVNLIVACAFLWIVLDFSLTRVTPIEMWLLTSLPSSGPVWETPCQVRSGYRCMWQGSRNSNDSHAMLFEAYMILLLMNHNLTCVLLLP